MHPRVALLALGIGALSPWIATGRADAVEPQKTDPEQCQANDKACVQDWYKEYSAGLLLEFKYYAGEEDFLAEMLAEPQATLLTAKLSLVLIEAGTKYSQWIALDDADVARNAGLDMTRYQAILGVCRDAISVMRTALFDLRQHRDKARVEAGQYLKNAIACEKAFGLAPMVSKLRGAGQGKRPPAFAAPAGPMDITPQKQPP